MSTQSITTMVKTRALFAFGAISTMCTTATTSRPIVSKYTRTEFSPEPLPLLRSSSTIAIRRTDTNIFHVSLSLAHTYMYVQSLVLANGKEDSAGRHSHDNACFLFFFLAYRMGVEIWSSSPYMLGTFCLQLFDRALSASDLSLVARTCEIITVTTLH